MRSDTDVSLDPKLRPFVVGDWRDIQPETCKTPDCTWNAWSAKIEVKLLEKNNFCVKEFKEASEQAVREAQTKKNRKQLKNLPFTGEITWETLHEIPEYRWFRYTNKACQYASIFETALVEEDGRQFLILTIPYSAVALVGRPLHLISNDTQQKILAVLPEIRKAELFPVSQTIAQEGNSYELQGDRLEAVDHVRLIGSDGIFYDRPAEVGFSSVVFGTNGAKDIKPVPAGIYVVQLLIHGIPVPAKYQVRDAQGTRLEPLTLNVPKSKPAKAAK